MEKIKVLIADDIEGILLQIRSAISNNSKIEIVGEAHDGQEEYDLIEKLEPDLVFTDNKMPNMNGIDVIDKVVNSNISKKPKFVLVTADTDLYSRANELGVICVVNKSNGFDRLNDIIDEYIEYENNTPIIENAQETAKPKEIFLKKLFGK